MSYLKTFNVLAGGALDTRVSPLAGVGIVSNVAPGGTAASFTVANTREFIGQVIPLQAVATVAAGQAIDVRSTVPIGTLDVANRILSLIQV
jgi:hypothetical protein